MKPIRKTAFMMLKNCAKQFEYFYFKDPGYEAFQEPVTDPTSPQGKGSLFHDAAEKLFEQCTISDMVKLERPALIKYLRERLPRISQIDPWLDYFAEFEARRFCFGLDAYGEDKIAEVFIPVDVEKYCKLKAEGKPARTGHVDRIDWLPQEESLCIVEYKTGRYYNLEKPRILTSLRSETGWYATILNTIKAYDKPINWWACINPMLQQYHVEKFHTMSLKAVEKQWQGLLKLIKNKGPFPRNISPLCGHCKYSNECLYNYGAGDFSIDG
jgi:hypothetical protein